MELTFSTLLPIFAMTAAGCWLGGAYAVYRGFQCLPDGVADLPFFSDDPRHITDEGRKWRKRIYMSVAGFLWSLLLMAAVKGF